MVPLTLRLRNFMSYGDDPVEIDFQGLHLVCLAGGNGHGKSALLDALTWALWGRSRARREDDLVRQGAIEMEVELCFAEGGARYRVLRKRTLRRSGGTAALELHALGDGGTSAITGGTISETQERLSDLLKLGYETFINSTFLLQGRADEFTVKPASQRKAVLGEILGLAEYDRLAERARERARAGAARVTAIKERMADAERELERRPRLREELELVQREQAAALQSLHTAELALKDAQAERHRLTAQEQELERVGSAAAALRREMETLQRRRDEAARIVAEAEQLLEQEQRITRDAAELRQVRAELDEMGARLVQVRGQERTAAAIRHDIESAAAALRAALGAAEAEEARLAALVGQEPTLRRQVSEHEVAEARIPTVEGERAALASDVRGLHDEIAALTGENERLKSEMGPLRDRLKLLKEKGAACPVCGAPMGEAERDRVYKQFEQEGIAKRDLSAANEGRSVDLQRRVTELEEQDKTLSVTLAGLHKIARETGRLRQVLHDAGAAAETAREARARAEATRRALDAGDYAHEARERLAAAEASVQAVGYDEERHAALQRRRDELAPAEAAESALATARERRDANQGVAAAADEDLARRAADLALAEQHAEALRAALADLPAVEERVSVGERSVAECRQALSKLEQQSAGITELLRHLDTLEEGLRERRAELAEAERESGAYHELSRIFGKAGIPAMLIDNALPELETNANTLLARMSDGTMQVRFDTQRSGVKGDLLETLDIQIADASGTRPYEMFSGGEAFRVNLAIRIALSRLLAERAGAQLQMLVIDEGFGTQDGQGRERLVEAINSIADDFERIMVITHIEDLKDLFNARIDVMKGREGSRVLVTTS